MTSEKINWLKQTPIVLAPTTKLIKSIALLSQLSPGQSYILIGSQTEIRGILTEQDVVSLVASGQITSEITIEEGRISHLDVITRAELMANSEPYQVLAILQAHQTQYLGVIGEDN
jgi:hypothetical protein